MLVLHIRVELEKSALKILHETGEVCAPNEWVLPPPDGRRIAPGLAAGRQQEPFVQILDFPVQRPGNVTPLAIAALLADEFEKLCEALFIAPLAAKDIGEHLAAENPLQLIVKDRHLACQPAFEGKRSKDPSEKTVERAQREKGKFLDELSEVSQTPRR